MGPCPGLVCIRCIWIQGVHTIKFGLILESIQVDHGIIIHVMRGILRLYFGKTKKCIFHTLDCICAYRAHICTYWNTWSYQYTFCSNGMNWVLSYGRDKKCDEDDRVCYNQMERETRPDIWRSIGWSWQKIYWLAWIFHAFVLCCKVNFSAASWLNCQKLEIHQPAVAGAAPKISGRPKGRITGVDMRHLLLLLLPFLLFDLLEDEIENIMLPMAHLW